VLYRMRIYRAVPENLSLFHDFYQRVKRALRRGLESPIDPEHLVRETQDAARRLAVERGVGEESILRVWTRFTAGYFLQHSPEEVAWHTQLLAEREAGSYEPLVALDGGPDGLDIYRRLLQQLPLLLKADALVLLEAAPPAAAELFALARRQFPDAHVRVERDYGAQERFVAIERAACQG